MDDDNDDDDDYKEWEVTPRRGSGKFPYNGFDKPLGGHKPGKTYSQHYKGDNSGGFGNPPVSGQRRRGGPGGPGRPKGSHAMDNAMKRVMKRKIPVTRNGKVEMLPPSEVWAERVLEAILAKNPTPKMIELGRQIMAEYGPKKAETAPAKGSSEGFSRDEQDLMLALLNRYTGSPPGETIRHVLGRVWEPYPQGEFRIFRREDGHVGLVRIEPDGDAGEDDPSADVEP